MARLELEIKSELSHIELHVVVKTSFGNNRATEFTKQWLENITIEQFEKMIELYDSFMSNSIPPTMDKEKFKFGEEIIKEINKP